MKRVNFRPVPLAALLAGALLLGASVGAQAAPLPTLPAPRAKALTAPAQPLPQPFGDALQLRVIEPGPAQPEAGM